MLLPRFIKKFLKKFFPRLYYSEKIQKIWFELAKPSPTKIIIFLVIMVILVLIFNVFSTQETDKWLYPGAAEKLGK